MSKLVRRNEIKYIIDCSEKLCASIIVKKSYRIRFGLFYFKIEKYDSSFELYNKKFNSLNEAFNYFATVIKKDCTINSFFLRGNNIYSKSKCEFYNKNDKLFLITFFKANEEKEKYLDKMLFILNDTKTNNNQIIKL